MRRTRNPAKLVFKQRLYFFLEVLTVFFGIFLFLLLPTFLPNLLVETDSRAFEPLYYYLRALVIVIAIPTFLIVFNFILEPRKRQLIIKEDISSAKKFLKLFKISKKNFKYQILYGFLLLFLVFIPLDFFTYLFLPEMLEYSVVALDVYSSSSLNSYLLENYFVFIISVLIIQWSVSLYEESLSRGFLTNRGSDYIHPISAVILSSFFFGLGHFSYIFTTYGINLPLIYPFIWFLQTFFVGIILAMIVIRRRWLFPAIFAHAVNNIISANTIWFYLKGNSFVSFGLYLYIPLLVISIILLIWQFSRIKEGVSIGFKQFISYFKNDISIKERTSHKLIRIFMDFFFGFLIYLVGIILI